MPCYYTGSAEGDAEYDATLARKAATAATRAACEMAKLLTKRQWAQLTPATQEWIYIHEKMDATRKDR